MAAKLFDVKTLVQAGIDPKTGLPIKLGSLDGGPQQDLKHMLKKIDAQEAINRYKWYNLPGDITGQELERMLYYKGQLAFFYLEPLNQFYFMPYALDGTIDFYGRFNSIHPVPFGGGTTSDKDTKKQADYLSTIRLDVKYAPIFEEDVDYDTMINSAVLIHDYSKGLSQTIVSRERLNDKIIDMESEALSFLRTSLINGTGINGVRVNDADQALNVKVGAKSTMDAALVGESYVPMIGNLEFQELTGGSLTKAEDYLLSAQAMDNMRLSTYGLDNGGLFQKKAHILESENSMNSNNIQLVYQDGLTIRQNFCIIANSIWGLGIWCEPSEAVLDADMDGDGRKYDDNMDGTLSAGREVK